jgi:hypothetical protein
MINPNIPDIGSTLTLTKPLGKPVSFKIGEIIEAKVLDVFSTGGIALKIKGSVLTAQAEMSLLKDSTVLFKVTGTDKQGSELKLQFMGYSGNAVQPQAGEPAKVRMLNRLMDDLSGLLSKNISSKDVSETIEQLIKALPSDINTVPKELLVRLQDLLKPGMSRQQLPEVMEQIIRALPSDVRTVPRELLAQLQDMLKTGLTEKSATELVEKFIRALPPDLNTVPKELLVRLQDLLKTGMSKAGEHIQTKLDKLMDLLPELLSPGDPLIRSMKNLREDVMIRIDNVLNASLKNALADTGVSLEAKIKVLVELLQRIDKPLTPADVSQIKTDLKAQLLQLREQFFTANKGGEAELVNSLLKDIETFQLLSKATDSFSTFLPVIWDELRKGEVSFRKNRKDNSVRSFSCRLNLDLESFGELSVIVLMVDRAFSVYMKADKNAFREILNASLHELHDRFSGSGLLLKNASVIDKELSPEELERLGSFERIVNIKI